MPKKPSITIDTPKIEVHPINSVKFRKDNPRTHSEDNLSLIRTSIERNRAGRSILIDEKNQTLAGEGTTRAAIEAGVKEVIVIETTGDQLVAVKRTDLSEDQKRELIILDNRANETSTWDNAQTFKMLQKLQDAGVGLDTFHFTSSDLEHMRLNAGFSNDDFNRFFKPDSNHKNNDPSKMHLNLIFDIGIGNRVLEELNKIDPNPEKAILKVLKLA